MTIIITMTAITQIVHTMMIVPIMTIAIITTIVITQTITTIMKHTKIHITQTAIATVVIQMMLLVSGQMEKEQSQFMIQDTQRFQQEMTAWLVAGVHQIR